MSRTIPQRELRNNIADVLRRAEAGTEFTITVHGRPVAQLGPVHTAAERRIDVDRKTLCHLLRETPVDEAFAADLARVRNEEEDVGEPWQRG